MQFAPQSHSTSVSAKRNNEKMYPRESLRDHGFGPRPVSVVEHFSVPFDDAGKSFYLAGRAWFPSIKEDAISLFPNVKGSHLYCEQEIGQDGSVNAKV